MAGFWRQVRQVWDGVTGRDPLRRELADVADGIRRDTIAAVREDIARQIETYTGPAPWDLPRAPRPDGGGWIDSRDATLAARIARGHTTT